MTISVSSLPQVTPNTDNDYPCLKWAGDSVVLFSSPNEGTYLKVGPYSRRAVGEVAEFPSSALSVWRPYVGPIVLENKQ